MTLTFAPSTTRSLLRRGAAGVALVGLALSVSACANAAPDDAAAGNAAETAATETADAAAPAETAAYPVTVDNCGDDLVIEAQPEKVMVLTTVPLGSIEAAGGLEQVTEYSGKFSGDWFSDDIRAHFADIEPLTEKVIQADLTREAIVEFAPDLVIGSNGQTINPQTLAEVGIPMYVLPAWCPNAPQTVSFDDAYAQVEVFGRIFGHPDAAAASVDDMKARVAAASADVGDLATAAFIWPDKTGVLKSYGAGSVATSQLEVLGLSNVFGDEKGRGFDISIESLVAQDPDVIVVVYPEDGTAEAAIDALRAVPGADALTALKEDRLLTTQPAMIDPAGAYSVVGLERLAGQLAGLSK
ncbi:ABC transporter substrate-binding protein [Microbacterium sp. No. 7]|uniref:ABC transporter substrate-binding protein n=1 Tax=Microbacterium sp. No. 7 TaxID=1714373 RepID=UPI0006D0BB61|nr:ABC transporter substrate-binding protein [Microbacterium sp. No. 7]ALJ22214.1 hypothetical protein AOA12_20945 [Microbacterium sp. No. 7]